MIHCDADGRGLDEYHFACLGTSVLRSLAKILGSVDGKMFQKINGSDRMMGRP